LKQGKIVPRLVGYYDGLIGSYIHAFNSYQNQRPYSPGCRYSPGAAAPTLVLKLSPVFCRTDVITGHAADRTCRLFIFKEVYRSCL